jgi:hypothetical protein
MGNAQHAGRDSYDQTVAAQAEQNSLVLTANALSNPSSSQSETSSTQPGSMAADTGSRKAEENWHGETIAVQANMNRLLQAVNQF